MKILNDKYYKIRHIPTGLFKASGQNGEFTSVGKIWRGGNLKAHLRLFETYAAKRRGTPLWQEIDQVWINGRHNGKRKHFPIEECEVVELTLTETSSVPLKNFINEEMRK